MNNYSLSIFSCWFLLTWLIPTSAIAVAVNNQHITQTITPSNQCSAKIEILTSLLLKDLPNYGNRIIQRTQELNQAAGIDNYIITTGIPEFEPLNLPQIQYNQDNSPPPNQVFFTTLERQYISDRKLQPNRIRKIERETYHWLFLTPTEDGWRMVTIYSRFGSSNQDHVPTPPQETSNGIIGQAVQLWLKDCRAGKIK